MTSELRLRINKYLESDLKRPPHVFAKIYAIDKSGGKRQLTRAARRELIPISHLKKHTKSIQLEPGRYIVEAVLPSGEFLSDDVSLGSNEKKDLVFRPEYSPREWLSWQHLVGNVPAIKPRTKRRVARKSSRKKGGGGGTSRRLARPIKAVEYHPPEVNVRLPIQLLNTPTSPLVGESNGDQVWAWLTQLTESTPKVLISKLNDNHNTIDVPPYAFDKKHSVFRVSWSKSSSKAHALSNRVKASRRFLTVPRRNSVELLSLPMPWRVIVPGKLLIEAPIEIAIQEPGEASDFCSSVSVLDTEFGMLVSYLSSGSIPEAREMAETAKAMLFEKMENPYAAAAGGYALVGTALQASDREWHGWVSNLMDWFQHIPDGAIQWGQLKLRMRRSSADIEAARKAFKLAFRRGLPFYSLGMRWLVDGLEAISHDDPEAAEMLTRVRPIAWLTNYQQPFTILKLGAHQNV